MSLGGDGAVGFFGKLPSHGDFISRGLPEYFLNTWDRWLQQCLVASQDSLGEAWLDRYLVSPLWRFVVSKSAIDDHAYAGLFFPSVDRVGRYFPMTVVFEIPPEIVGQGVFEAVDPWLDFAEELLLSALDREQNDLDAIARELTGAADELDFEVASPGSGGTLSDFASVSHWRIAGSGGREPGDVLASVLFASLSASLSPLTLWWSNGAASVDPSVLCVRGLPSPGAFPAMISGFAGSSTWRGDLEAAGPGLEPEALEVATYRSATCTTAGKVRANNEDTFFASSVLGMWAVADGMGGHSHGEVASRMITDALSSLTLSGSLETRAEQVRRELIDVNGELRRMAQVRSDEFDAGSTVVALLCLERQAVVIWAGDCRAYLLRSGKLEKLTIDHVAESEEFSRSHVVTRAVGGEDLLDLEIGYFDLADGDRVLLCSDGLHGELSAEALEAGMNATWDDTLAAQLVDQVLAGRAPDNATAVVVECTF